jgi:hypothetical protein
VRRDDLQAAHDVVVDALWHRQLECDPLEDVHDFLLVGGAQSEIPLLACGRVLACTAQEVQDTQY